MEKDNIKPVEGGYIPKKIAAIEVYKAYGKTQLTAGIAIGSVFAIPIFSTFSDIMGAVIGMLTAFVFIFMLTMAMRERKRLNEKYHFNPKVAKSGGIN